ncbi:MAG TPA: adenosylmethionine decarboxylase [Usitatibacteraceae bacterium]|nr:adenosylmethionine decarboxylase [Usitatibacteraceae bacterium]
MKGLHIIADLYGCRNRDLLASSAMLRETCVAACKAVGLTVLGDHFYQFEGLDATQVGGATGAVVFAESHLAIHTWPERDGATLDVYVCNVTSDNSAKAEQLYETLAGALQPGDVMVERVWRGRDLPLKKQRLAVVG